MPNANRSSQKIRMNSLDGADCQAVTQFDGTNVEFNSVAGSIQTALRFVELTRHFVQMSLRVYRQVGSVRKYCLSRPLVFSLEPRCH
jgi:hypothetical protein